MKTFVIIHDFGLGVRSKIKMGAANKCLQPPNALSIDFFLRTVCFHHLSRKTAVTRSRAKTIFIIRRCPQP